MELQYAHLIYRESGMFAPGKGFLEMGAGGGDGESLIRLSELKFQAEGQGLCSESDLEQWTCVSLPGYVDLAIFEQKSFDSVGVSVGDTRYYCCDERAIEMEACSTANEGELLFADPKDVWWNKRLKLEPGVPSALDHDEIYRIAETGMYVVLMANCDDRTGTIHIGGHSEWKNPYGYLPGEAYGDLPFFFGMSVAYLALGIVWMVLCMAYIKDLLPIQMWAAGVLLLGMMETGAQYFDYRDWNIEGTRSAGVQSFAILFGAAKRALSLSLVLMVCMGYGVVRPSLGRDVHRIMAMALIYFVTSALWVALTSAPASGDKEFATRAGEKASVILMFVSVTIMMLFYIWIFQSIFGVIQHLTARRQTMKLQLYLHFRAVVVGSALFGLAWLTYCIVRSLEHETERRWQTNWTVNAIWEVLYLAVLLAVCFMLRPSMNSQRFQYASVPTESRYEDGGDILLKVIEEEDAEYGGVLDDGEDKDDEFSAPAAPGKKHRPFSKKEPLLKKENQD
ncbi:unnamed protein product [Ascophyllum nodosum]